MDRTRCGIGSGKRVAVIDPSLCQGGPWDVNLGDQIIIEAVLGALAQRCGLEVVARVPSLRKLEPAEYRVLRAADYVIVGGTNLLSSNMNSFRQWMVGLADILRLREIILCGVGWWQYQPPPNLYTRLLLRNLLSKRSLHSVRDSFTKRQLQAAGIARVANTSCPSLWGISPELLQKVPAEKGRNVVVTLTCYNKQPLLDKQLLDLLLQNYDTVFFWPLCEADKAYAGELSARLTYVSDKLSDWTAFLEREADLDYVGTRLHAGIRALQKGRRTLVLAVDNRALEIGKDVQLAVVERSDIARIRDWIHSRQATVLHLPQAEINNWIAQFKTIDQAGPSTLCGPGIGKS